MTWAAPTPTRPVTDGFVITGTEGWLTVNTIYKTAGRPVIRVLIKSVVKEEGKPESEKEEVIEEEDRGVQVELSSFFGAIGGRDDGLGDPVGALRDVAIIQAGLNSEGALIDLTKLVPI